MFKKVSNMKKEKSILEEIYKMDIDTLRKYCIRLLKDNAEYFRENNIKHNSQKTQSALKCECCGDNPTHILCDLCLSTIKRGKYIKQNKDSKKECPECKEEYQYEDRHFAYNTEKGKYCRNTGKPIQK